MKKVLLSGVGIVVLAGAIYGTYALTKEKVYLEKDVNCDFDAGICYDLKGNPITGRITSYDNNILISDIEYKNGKEDGLLKIYQNDGSIFLEGTYKEGKPHGMVKEYNADGSIFSYDEFQNGIQHGKSIIYNKNNKILKEWNYNMGSPVGVGKVFYDNGTLQVEINFDKGEIKNYNENGSINTIAHFDEKGYNGLWTIYNKDGSIKAEINYVDNKPTSAYCLDKDQNKVEFDETAHEDFAKTGQTPCDKTPVEVK